MKKNVFPLVVIALVVAVLSTGIFYGLIVSRMDASPKSGPGLRLVATGRLENGHVVKLSDFRVAESKESAPGPLKPEDLEGRTLTEKVEDGQTFTDNILSPANQRSLASAIPEGMRAVTMHVSDSSSVLEILRSGDKIDVQSLISRQRQGEPDFEVRTILQNATVFTVGTTEKNSAGRGVLTLLVTPQDAARLSLADAASRLRVVLRNRKDAGQIPTSVVSLNRIDTPPAPPRPVVTSSFTPRPPARPVEFEIQLLEVSVEDLHALSASVDVAEWKKKLIEWQGQKKGSLWASSRLEAAKGGEVTWHGADSEAAVRVRLETRPSSGNPSSGDVELRVQTETTLVGADAGKRHSESPWKSAKQASMIAGVLPANQAAAWREKFAPGRPTPAANSELIVLITPATAQ